MRKTATLVDGCQPLTTDVQCIPILTLKMIVPPIFLHFSDMFMLYCHVIMFTLTGDPEGDHQCREPARIDTSGIRAFLENIIVFVFDFDFVFVFVFVCSTEA